MRPARANKPNGYLLGSYRVATAPEPNSSRLTSLKSTCFDSPALDRSPTRRGQSHFGKFSRPSGVQGASYSKSRFYENYVSTGAEPLVQPTLQTSGTLAGK
jgi:hypothetical protein